jgi:hypothetical protein
MIKQADFHTENIRDMGIYYLGCTLAMWQFQQREYSHEGHALRENWNAHIKVFHECSIMSDGEKNFWYGNTS